MTAEEKQYILDMAELEDATIKDFEEALVQLRTGPGINEDVSEEYDKATDLAIKLLEREIKTKEKQIQGLVLDTIRNEIADLVCNDPEEDYEYGHNDALMKVVQIIDKYKEGEE